MINNVKTGILFSIYTFYAILAACFINSSLSLYALMVFTFITFMFAGGAVTLYFNHERWKVETYKIFDEYEFTIYQKVAFFINIRNLSLAFTLPGTLVPFAFGQRHISLSWLLVAVVVVKCCNGAIHRLFEGVSDD